MKPVLRALIFFFGSESIDHVLLVGFKGYTPGSKSAICHVAPSNLMKMYLGILLKRRSPFSGATTSPSASCCCHPTTFPTHCLSKPSSRFTLSVNLTGSPLARGSRPMMPSVFRSWCSSQRLRFFSKALTGGDEYGAVCLMQEFRKCALSAKSIKNRAQETVGEPKRAQESPGKLHDGPVT